MMEVWHDNSFLDNVSINEPQVRDIKNLALLRHRRCRTEISRLLRECEVLRDKLIKKNQKRIFGI